MGMLPHHKWRRLLVHMAERYVLSLLNSAIAKTILSLIKHPAIKCNNFCKIMDLINHSTIEPFSTSHWRQ